VDIDTPQIDHTPRRNLEESLWIFTGVSMLWLAAGFWLIWQTWALEFAVRWLPLPALAAGSLLVLLHHNLDWNRRSGESLLLPELGWGNFLTFGRGLLVAAMTGFILLPKPDGWLGWIPGMLYVLACFLDFFDGYLARISKHVTRLGEILDLYIDGFGVLVAALLSIGYGQTPGWYLAVAFAYPLFTAGLWLRRRLDLPIFELPARVSRRVFAGLQMGFLAIILLPVFSPPASHIAALLFGLPLLVGFILDWLAVSGLSQGRQLSYSIQPNLAFWLPVGIRSLILLLNMTLLSSWIKELDHHGSTFLVISIGYLSVAVLVIAGILARVNAILALCTLGLVQIFAPLSLTQLALAGSFTALIYLGSGSLSLWRPDEALFLRRFGGQRSSNLEQSL
jgi:CDP-diacylglycerol--glycerol-3-phosphate 3-phosphatidyltransferase